MYINTLKSWYFSIVPDNVPSVVGIRKLANSKNDKFMSDLFFDVFKRDVFLLGKPVWKKFHSEKIGSMAPEFAARLMKQ